MKRESDRRGKDNVGRRRDALERGLCAAVFVLCCAMTAAYLVFGYGAYLDADMASELALARHLCDEGALVSASWYYSTEVRILSTQLVYAPLMALFGRSWRLVRTLGSLLLLAMLAGAGFFAARQAGAQRRWALLLAGLCISVCSPLYAQNVVIGTYYVPHAVLTMLTLSLYAGMLRRGISAGRLAALLALSLVMGLTSVRYMICALLPLCGAALWQTVFPAGEETAPRTGGQLRLLTAAMAAALCGAAGYVINQKVLPRFLHAGFGYYGGTAYADWAQHDLFAQLQAALGGLLGAMGFQGGVPLFSAQGIANALVLLALAACLLLLVRALRALRGPGADGASRFACLMLSISGMLSLALFVLMRSLYFDRYWLPVMMLGAPVMAVCLTHERNGMLRALAAAVTALSVLASSALCIRASMHHPQVQTDKRMAAVDAIRERGLTLGYATFWNANIVTELSDGEIEVVALERDSDGGMRLYRWLEAEDSLAMSAPEEPVFLLLGVWEEDGMEDFLSGCQAERVELEGWINLYAIPQQRLLFDALSGV